MASNESLGGKQAGSPTPELKRKPDLEAGMELPTKRQKTAPMESAGDNPHRIIENPTTQGNEVSTETQTGLSTSSTVPQSTQDAQPLSRSAQKKLAKRQAWEAGRDERKAKRKQKTQERKERKRAQRDEEAANPTKHPDPPRKKSVQVPVTFLVDCQFDEYMNENEMVSMGSQLTRCYADNRRAVYRAHLGVCGFEGRLKDRFEGLLNNMHRNWHGVKFRSEGFMDVAGEARKWMSLPHNRLVGPIARHMPDTAGDAAHTDDTNEEEQKKEKNEEESTAQITSTPAQRDEGAQAANNGSVPCDPPTAQNPHPHLSEEEPDAEPEADMDAKPQSEAQPPKPRKNLQLPKGEIIYLTSDSPNTLEELKPNSVYIIGGIVDKNRHKGLCYRIAQENNVKTAKLPIGEYLKMQSRTVLTTNHVNEIMVKWLECGDWGEAFMAVMPKRKEASLLKGEEGKQEENVKGDALAEYGEAAEEGEAEVEADGEADAEAEDQCEADAAEENEIAPV